MVGPTEVTEDLAPQYNINNNKKPVVGSVVVAQRSVRETWSPVPDTIGTVPPSATPPVLAHKHSTPPVSSIQAPSPQRRSASPIHMLAPITSSAIPRAPSPGLGRRSPSPSQFVMEPHQRERNSTTTTTTNAPSAPRSRGVYAPPLSAAEISRTPLRSNTVTGSTPTHSNSYITATTTQQQHWSSDKVLAQRSASPADRIMSQRSNVILPTVQATEDDWLSHHYPAILSQRSRDDTTVSEMTNPTYVSQSEPPVNTVTSKPNKTLDPFDVNSPIFSYGDPFHKSPVVSSSQQKAVSATSGTVLSDEFSDPFGKPMVVVRDENDAAPDPGLEMVDMSDTEGSGMENELIQEEKKDPEYISNLRRSSRSARVAKVLARSASRSPAPTSSNPSPVTAVATNSATTSAAVVVPVKDSVSHVAFRKKHLVHRSSQCCSETKCSNDSTESHTFGKRQHPV
jgi:hypothetical protein